MTPSSPPRVEDPEAAAVVAQLRQDREQLQPLKARLSATLRGQRCLVLGSAPDPKLPAPRHHDRCICVNGSPAVAARYQLQPDLTVMAGYSTLPKRDVSRHTLSHLSGLHTRQLLFVSAGNDSDSARQTLCESGFSWEDWLDVAPLVRAALAGEAAGQGEPGLGPRDERVSNGVFAVLVALWAGARHVTLAGITLAGGHDYIKEQTPRYHLEGDQRCLRHLARQYPRRIATTHEGLAEATGLPLFSKRPLWPGRLRSLMQRHT